MLSHRPAPSLPPTPGVLCPESPFPPYPLFPISQTYQSPFRSDAIPPLSPTLRRHENPVTYLLLPLSLLTAYGIMQREVSQSSNAKARQTGAAHQPPLCLCVLVSLCWNAVAVSLVPLCPFVPEPALTPSGARGRVFFVLKCRCRSAYPGGTDMSNLTTPAAPLQLSAFGPARLRTGDSKSPESTRMHRLSDRVHRRPLSLPIPDSLAPRPSPLRLFASSTPRLLAVSIRETQTISA